MSVIFSCSEYLDALDFFLCYHDPYSVFVVSPRSTTIKNSKWGSEIFFHISVVYSFIYLQPRCTDGVLCVCLCVFVCVVPCSLHLFSYLMNVYFLSCVVPADESSISCSEGRCVASQWAVKMDWCGGYCWGKGSDAGLLSHLSKTDRGMVLGPLLHFFFILEDLWISEKDRL